MGIAVSGYSLGYVPDDELRAMVAAIADAVDSVAAPA